MQRMRTAHDILLCIQTGKKLSDENRMRYEGGQYYVKSPEEMSELFPYAQEALENTQKIADRCHVEIEFGVTKLPKYDVPDGLTSLQYLTKMCEDGLVERYGDENGVVEDSLKERLKYELDVITRHGLRGLFPDCVGFHQVCQGQWNRGGAGTRLGCGKYRGILSGNHQH